MKKLFIALALASMALTSCVTLGKYEDLESRYNQVTKDRNLAKRELKEIKDENAELQRQNQALTVDVQDLTNAKNANDQTIADLRRQLENARQNYDTTMENYMQQLSGKNRDLDKANKLLNARTKELNDKERAFNDREQELLAQQRELEARQAELEANEAAAKAALAAKEQEVENIRNAVTNALVGFTNKGLQVETKDGKVYVSMESKLMFASASWEVSKEGVQAVKELAKVLEDNPDLDILVEGHTDNDAYNGRTDIKDNWDLSVMRATAIVKLLLQNGPKISPSRIEACGHGEFAPKVENSSAANKAQNRRTEIILTPKLSDVLNIVK